MYNTNKRLKILTHIVVFYRKMCNSSGDKLWIHAQLECLTQDLAVSAY